jgi:hypothetical protein
MTSDLSLWLALSVSKARILLPDKNFNWIQSQVGKMFLCFFVGRGGILDISMCGAFPSCEH